MNAELDRLRKEMTREEFIEYNCGRGCPEENYGLKNGCTGNRKGYCYLDCYREAVKDIQFKDDIETAKNQIELIKLLEVEVEEKVNHPPHYTSGKYEVIDIIESIVNSMDLTPYQGYLLGNIIKYIARFKHKGGTEDLKKANVYLEKLTKELST